MRRVTLEADASGRNLRGTTNLRSHGAFLRQSRAKINLQPLHPPQILAIVRFG